MEARRFHLVPDGWRAVRLFLSLFCVACVEAGAGREHVAPPGQGFSSESPDNVLEGLRSRDQKLEPVVAHKVLDG